MRPQLPKFASMCLLLALSACSNQEGKTSKRLGVGATTKVGQDLTARKWCLPPGADNQGHLTWEELVFKTIEGAFSRTRFVLYPDSTKAETAKQEGSWAIVGESLVEMLPQRTIQYSISPSTRESDKAACYDLSEDNSDATKVQQICPCTF